MNEQKYLEILDRMVEIELEQAALASPDRPAPPPACFASLDDASAYQYSLNAYGAANNKHAIENNLLQTEIDNLRAQIAANLPVSNSWVKIGNYAVVKFYSAWGGMHAEVVIQKWEEGLAPLPDQTEFS
jgi:hypothetical protein